MWIFRTPVGFVLQAATIDFLLLSLILEIGSIFLGRILLLGGDFEYTEAEAAIFRPFLRKPPSLFGSDAPLR